MKKHITLSLDEDIVDALRVCGGRDPSPAVNAALREALAAEAHRAALLEWLDELDAEYGAGTPEDHAAAEALLTAIERGEPLRGEGPV